MPMPEDGNKSWINFLLYNNTQLNEKMHNLTVVTCNTIKHYLVQGVQYYS
jgi:uncharacterized protein YaaN involved in tellurite resistance